MEKDFSESLYPDLPPEAAEHVQRFVDRFKEQISKAAEDVIDGGKRVSEANPLDRLVMPDVLDACCGSRMMWFNKNDERALFIDRRKGMKEMDLGTPSTKGRDPCVISPDKIADFRNMPFNDDSFVHVVFDPPHIEKKMGTQQTGILPFKYGVLDATWRDDIKRGFAECFRVLKPGGTLIFKWCETEIPLKNVLLLTPEKPLYGHRSGKKANTHWVAFVKA